MAIYITGDTHGEIGFTRFSSKNWKEGKTLSKKDYLIITGDFGLLWKAGIDKSQEYWTKWFDEKPWTTLFIDGNHENHNMLNDLPQIEKFNNTVGKVSDSIFHLKRGNIYTIENKSFFAFGGALSIDKHLRTNQVTWWPEELPSYSEYEKGLSSLESVDWNVDCVITHTTPSEYVRLLGLAMTKGDTVSEYLSLIYSKLSFKNWYCGHFHIDDMLIATDNYPIQFLYKTIIKNT